MKTLRFGIIGMTNGEGQRREAQRCARSAAASHGAFINVALGATSVPRVDPQCWKRTRPAYLAPGL